MKKVYLIIFSLLLCTSFLFCKEWDIYDGADKKTLSTIKDCDAFIQKGQYQKAYSLVASCENEYIIYKYVEVCTQYFAQSIMHKMFAFVNLKEGQTLYDVRTKEGDFNIAYNEDGPEEIIQKYKKEHGNSIVLELALANYYYDAVKRYGKQWLKTPDEVMPYVLKTYEKALNKKVYDEFILASLAQVYTSNKDFNKAEDIYEKLTQKFSKNGNYWYNYTVCLMQCQKYEKAIITAQKAVDNPEDNPDYHYDAYMILSDAYCWNNNGKDADRVLREAIKKYPKKSGAYIHLAELCFFFPADYSKDDLNSFVDSAVKTEPTAYTIYSCINLFYTNQQPSQAIAFCERNLKVIKDNEGKAYLNYYLSQFYFMTEGNREKSSIALAEAKRLFKKAGNTKMESECDAVRKDMLGE